MKTAEEYLTERLGENKYKELLVNQGIEAWIIAAVNNSRKEAIEECAERAQIIRQPTGEGQSSETYISGDFEGDLGYEDYIPVTYSIYKESILSLIKEIE